MDAPPTPNPEQARGVTVEEIVSGTRCSPFTLKEFEGFLIHEEHSVENLQFTVWYRSYCERFKALAPEYQALSDVPAERYTQYSTPSGSIRTASSIKGKDDKWWDRLIRRRSSASVLIPDEEAGIQGLGIAPAKAKEVEKDTDNISLHSAVDPDSPAFAGSTAFPLRRLSLSAIPPDVNPRPQSTLSDDSQSITSEALDRKTRKFPNLRFVNLSPLVSRKSRELPEGTPLPFVDEIQLVMTTFILPGSTKELNIDARLRRHILKSLQPAMPDGSKGPPVTTHPDVFREASDHTYTLMERSLPHYMQWAKGNINTPKMIFWYGVGLTNFSIGIMIALVIMYHVHTRWWRIFAYFFLQFGAWEFYSASRYFCSQVHGRGARQLYPWELTSEIDIIAPTAPTFAMVGGGNKTADATAKATADLHASLPFLFEGVPASSTGSETWGSQSSTKGGKKEGGGGETNKATFRSKYLGAWRSKEGKRVPVFGPERVVEDPYIKAVHNKQIQEVLIIGGIVAVAVTIMFTALPEQRPR